MKYFSDVIFIGMDDIFILWFYISVHSSLYFCVCGDDRITCYPGADRFEKIVKVLNFY